MLLRRIFEEKDDGFYVDVGAHQPVRFSNTYFFYRRGWCGVNIDAMPGSMAKFRRKRPRDICLEAGIARQPGEMIYYMFNEPALNSFDPTLASSRNGSKGIYKIIGTKRIVMRTLASVLDESLPAGQQIDFLSVDVEGLDYDVLLSNDWVKFRPTAVVAEAFGSSLEDLVSNQVSVFLRGQGYKLVAKSIHSVIYILDRH
jgi:FkbM family methyltransferase